MKKEFTEIVGGTEIRYVLDEATGTYLPDWELPEQRELGRYGKVVIGFCVEITNILWYNLNNNYFAEECYEKDTDC